MPTPARARHADAPPASLTLGFGGIRCITNGVRQVSKTELSDPIALRIPVDVLADIEKIATASERTRSWVIVRALRHYLAGEGADCLAILRGREQIAAGDSHDFDDVLKELDDIVRGKVAS